MGTEAKDSLKVRINMAKTEAEVHELLAELKGYDNMTNKTRNSCNRSALRRLRELKRGEEPS